MLHILATARQLVHDKGCHASSPFALHTHFPPSPLSPGSGPLSVLMTLLQPLVYCIKSAMQRYASEIVIIVTCLGVRAGHVVVALAK